LHKGYILAKHLNPGAANNAVTKRSFEKIINNCIAGLLAEHLWEVYLNSSSTLVRTTTYQTASTQIDLEVISNHKKIEVRSSFPRNGIEFALCSSRSQFDVIGPYVNDYKPGEIQKDYYVRTLFHLRKIRELKKPDGTVAPVCEKIIDKLKIDSFEVYLTGGATWTIMTDNSIAADDTFIPQDEFEIKKMKTATSYRVIPFSKAFDTVEMYELISSKCAT
jgi:hypothetical protein